MSRVQSLPVSATDVVVGGHDAHAGTGHGYDGDVEGATTQGTITALTGLAPGTTYHYRLVASNAAGTGYGPDATFTTTGAARTGTFTSFTLPAVPLIATTQGVFPTETPNTKSTPKGLTNKQKLKNALKACRKQKKSKRSKCEKQAHKRYK